MPRGGKIRDALNDGRKQLGGWVNMESLIATEIMAGAGFDFLMIDQEHGLLLLHFTYWNLTVHFDGQDHTNLLCGSIANEIKRQQMRAGLAARFEVLSLVEPHKTRQGSVTMVRKLAYFCIPPLLIQTAPWAALSI